MEEITALPRAARNFVKNLIKPVSFLTHTFFNSTEMFLGELMAVFIDHRTNSALEYVEYLNTPVSHTHTTIVTL